ncbi:Lipoprotein signal peptidase [Candidatus Entotheonellaceae bacterium PAL068K]
MRKWQLLMCLVGVVVLLDQSTKLYVHATFELHESRPVLTHFFHLTYVQNPGAAFGLLAGQNTVFLRLFFPIVTVGAVIALVVYFISVPSQRPRTLWGICLIIGGALGNGIDRLWLKRVIDFVDIHWFAYHWPTFNVADSAICVGVGLLLFDAFRHPAA